MGLWDALRDVAGFVGQATGIGPLFDSVAAAVARHQAEKKPVAFTVAVIGLSAKMAKADGIVSEEETAAFRRIVDVPPGEERNVERLFDLAKRDVAGFEAYAEKMAALADRDPVLLADVLDGLFHIATADAFVHHLELTYLERVAEIFGLDDAAFRRIAGRHVRMGRRDPYAILGLDREASDTEVKRQWRRLVAECHPDLHFAKGLPSEAIRLLNDRLAQVNAAYEEIRLERGLV